MKKYGQLDEDKVTLTPVSSLKYFHPSMCVPPLPSSSQFLSSVPHSSPIISSSLFASVWCIPSGHRGPEGSMNKSLTLAPQTLWSSPACFKTRSLTTSLTLCTPLFTSINNGNVNKASICFSINVGAQLEIVNHLGGWQNLAFTGWMNKENIIINQSVVHDI